MPKTLRGYEGIDGGQRLRFEDLLPGPGLPTDWYVVLTDAELKAVLSPAEVVALIQSKVDMRMANAGISNKLDPLIGTVFTPTFSTEPLLPSIVEPPPIMITPWSKFAIGPELAALAVAAPASTAWGTANLARSVPFVLPQPMTVRKMFWYNGATVAGNVQAGIYNSSAEQLAATASVAQGTASVLQEAALPSPRELPPGRYFLTLVLSSATATIFSATLSAQLCKALGLAQQTAALPLPASTTPVVYSTTVIPFVGVSARNLVV